MAATSSSNQSSSSGISSLLRSRKLYVTVVSAANISSKSFVSVGLPSTFVKVELFSSSSNSSRGQEYRTNVYRSSLSPRWYQQFVFDVREQQQQQLMLGFTCYSHGNVYNSAIGRAEVRLSLIVKELEEKVQNSSKDGEFEMTKVGEENDEKVFKGNRLVKTLPLYAKKKGLLFRSNDNNTEQHLLSVGELIVHLSLDLTEEQISFLRKQSSMDNTLLQQQQVLLVARADEGVVEPGEVIDREEEEESFLEVESYAEDSSYTISQRGFSFFYPFCNQYSSINTRATRTVAASERKVPG